jgi:hypothetical protein
MLKLLTTSSDIDNAGIGQFYAYQDSSGTENLLGAVGAVRTGADNTGALVFRTYNAGTPNEWMRITSSGNVGIGTTGPQDKLHIYTSSGNIGGIVETAGSGNYGYFDIRTPGSRVTLTAASSYGYVGTTNNYPFLFFINNAEKMRIDTAGNVGIGTTAPTQKLDVAGNVNASAYYDRDNSARYLDPSGTSYIGAMSMYGTLSMNNYDVSGANSFGVNDPGAGEGLVFGGTAAGWVIDVSPLDRSNNDGNLNLYGTANNIIAWRPTYIYTSATPQLVINSTGTTAQFILQTSNTVRGNMTADNSGNVYITPGNYLIVPSGNVGIGTTSPSSKLEVSGDIEINDGAATGSYKIKGKRNFYAGDETQVLSTNTTAPGDLKKQFTAVIDDTYGIKPSYVNVIARIWNAQAGNTTYINVTMEGCANTELSATGTAQTVVKGSINTASCANGLYPTKVYLRTTSGGTAYNDLIEFYLVE